MKLLAIETSCDETAVAVLEAEGGLAAPSFRVLGNALYSQIQTHALYGGVFPALAKREHSKNLVPLFLSALKQAEQELPEPQKHIAIDTHGVITKMLEREPELSEQFLDQIIGLSKPNIDAIAVTTGPGLEPALWVGINFARALSFLWDIPLIPTNHMEGHITSVLMKNGVQASAVFPAVALLISGGHTELVLVHAWGHYERIGVTRDDAVGEAFDKIARLLGLPYPGGPAISKLAAAARDRGENLETPLPRPMIHSDDYDFSFSGLKTAVRYAIEQETKIVPLSEMKKRAYARGFEDAVIDVLYHKTKRALEHVGAHTLIIGGGVIANTALRETFQKLQQEMGGLTLLIPDMALTTDNAVMIGFAGYLRFVKTPEEFHATIPEEIIRANGNLSLDGTSRRS